jgi:hypothetical protein
MSVIVKGGRWKLIRVSNDADDIELLEPTEGEIRKLEVGDIVLAQIELSEDNINCLLSKVVAILEPSPEPQKGLPEKMTVQDMGHREFRTATLSKKLNEIIDYLKAQKGE